MTRPLWLDRLARFSWWCAWRMAIASWGAFAFAGSAAGTQSIQGSDIPANAPRYADYAASPSAGRQVPPDVRSHPRSRTFRTELLEAASEGPNFAGHYRLAHWGCGALCYQWAIIDLHTGRVYHPRALRSTEHSHVHESLFADQPFAVHFRLDSRLLVVMGERNHDPHSRGIAWLEWTGTQLQLLHFVAAAPAQSVPSAVRQAALRWAADAGVEATEISKAQGLFRPVHIASPGSMDWLVDFSALKRSPVCGTGGCALQVWIQTRPSSHALVLDRPVLNHRVMEDASGRVSLTLDVHGTHCGGTGSNACTYHLRWHDPTKWAPGYLGVAGVANGPQRYPGPIWQPLSVKAPVTGVVARTMAAYRAACTAAAGSADLSDALAYLPDLNGDGRQELLFDASWAYCLRGDEPVPMRCGGDACKSRLFTAYGGRHWYVAGTYQPFDYVVAFQGSSPQLLVRPPDCHEQCLERTLVWQPDTKQFTPSAASAHSE